MTEPDLLTLVGAHYDNPWLMRLQGEVHFDDDLADAEVDLALSLFGRRPEVAFLPCAGTLRHAAALVRRGVGQIVAVDLSAGGLAAGERHYAGQLNGVEIHHADVRDTHGYARPGGFEHAILMANSLGDITDLEGHLSFVRALAGSLTPNGTLVFDYIADRYNPPAGELLDTTWTETMVNHDGSEQRVFDRRTRILEPISEGIGLLQCTCEIRAEDGTLIEAHRYDRLTIRDDVLRAQFASCGLVLDRVGAIVDLSPYHRHRVDTRNDLGMIGTPDHVYVARPMPGATTAPRP